MKKVLVMTHQNPFQEGKYSDAEDLQLITSALGGNRQDLSELVKRHQQYIFNVALKMVNNVEDAEDIAQFEIDHNLAGD